MQPSKLGAVIREQRLKKGMGLRDLAERSGVDASILSRLETGAQESLRRNNYVKVALGLGLTYDDLRALAGDLPTKRPARPSMTLHDWLRADGVLPEEDIAVVTTVYDGMVRARRSVANAS
jgi:transcriptional regulator with XRE-family HTH domain